MKNLTGHWQITILMILLVFCLSVMTGCGKRNVVIPDSREIKDLSDGTGPMPGWYGISGGYLRNIFRDCEIAE
jgi:hypothetical protein